MAFVQRFFTAEYQSLFEEHLSCLVLWTLTSVIEIQVSHEGNSLLPTGLIDII